MPIIEKLREDGIKTASSIADALNNEGHNQTKRANFRLVPN